MNPLVLVERRGDLMFLTLNRPERHNSLVPELLELIKGALSAVRESAETRVVILQANGRSFSTGGDLSGFQTNLGTLKAYSERIVDLLNQVIQLILDLPVPVLAAVQGPVTGGSIGLVLASDIILVTPNTSFTPYYSVVGFSPDGGWTAILPDLIGVRRTADILINNLTITAEQAVEWGIASRLVEANLLPRITLEIAQEITSRPADTLRHTKALLNARFGGLSDRLVSEKGHFVEIVDKPETRDRMLAYLDQLHRS